MKKRPNRRRILCFNLRYRLRLVPKREDRLSKRRKLRRKKRLRRRVNDRNKNNKSGRGKI